jgi:hypothetical protein
MLQSRAGWFNGRHETSAWGGQMDGIVLAFLTQDGITNGAIYALLGLSLVLVFSVTRVIFIPQGEFVAYGR